MYLYFTTLSQPKIVVINNTGSKDLGGMNEPPQNNSLFMQSMITNDAIPNGAIPNGAIPNGAIPNGAIPVNIESRGPSPSYTQIGILTRSGDLILPLMGRRLTSGRDKLQYYTVSNTGNMNTKLPISKNGKSCTGEYGCDEIYDGDTVYVEGYSDTFRATIYENSRFNYIPYL